MKKLAKSAPRSCDWVAADLIVVTSGAPSRRRTWPRGVLRAGAQEPEARDGARSSRSGRRECRSPSPLPCAITFPQRPAAWRPGVRVGPLVGGVALGPRPRHQDAADRRSSSASPRPRTQACASRLFVGRLLHVEPRPARESQPAGRALPSSLARRSPRPSGPRRRPHLTTTAPSDRGAA